MRLDDSSETIFEPDRARVDELEAESVGHEPGQKAVRHQSKDLQSRSSTIRRLEVRTLSRWLAVSENQILYYIN